MKEAAKIIQIALALEPPKQKNNVLESALKICSFQYQLDIQDFL